MQDDEELLRVRMEREISALKKERVALQRRARRAEALLFEAKKQARLDYQRAFRRGQSNMRARVIEALELLRDCSTPAWWYAIMDRVKGVPVEQTTTDDVRGVLRWDEEQEPCP